MVHGKHGNMCIKISFNRVVREKKVISRREGEHFKAYYMQRLKERGFMAEGGTVKMQGLAEQFISYYTPEHLEIV
ncbi:MAG: hypothetical protein AB9856_10635 [Cellulosilyticaceae bacterium]